MSGPASSRPAPDASGIEIESGVGAQSELGYVQLRWGEQSGQLTPREARIHALAILEAANAAEHDAVVFRWLRRQLVMPIETAAEVLRDLRRHRAQQEEETP